LSQRTNVCHNTPWFVALTYLEYRLLSNIELALLLISTMMIDVLRDEAYIIASGLHGLHLVKNLHIINEILHVSERKIEYMINEQNLF
jgi:hypothetical protein